MVTTRSEGRIDGAQAGFVWRLLDSCCGSLSLRVFEWRVPALEAFLR